MKKYIVGALVAAALLTGCNDSHLTPSSSGSWCEYDSTDTRVDDSFCAQGVQGYEWEPDGYDSPALVPNVKKYTTVRPTTRQAAPTYKAPAYKAPTYKAPAYKAPTYKAPSPPAYKAPAPAPMKMK